MLQGVTYPGGKNGAGVYQTIINHLPPHETYIEPFLGGGAILRLKRPAAVNIGIDRDPAVIAGFEIWRSYLAPAGDTTRSDEARRRRTPILAIGRNSKASPGPTDPAGDGRPPLTIARPTISGDPSSFAFFQGDGIEMLKRAKFDPGTLIYCDPPYMHETRGSDDLYRFEMTDVDHRRLLRVLRRLPAMVVISGYWTSLYAATLEDWNHSTFQTTNRAGQLTQEHLWFNFPAPLELHDYRFLGGNFRERERIKRKKARWVGKLKRMPLLERQAIMGALSEIRGPSPSQPARGSTAAARAKSGDFGSGRIAKSGESGQLQKGTAPPSPRPEGP